MNTSSWHWRNISSPWMNLELSTTYSPSSHSSLHLHSRIPSSSYSQATSKPQLAKPLESQVTCTNTYLPTSSSSHLTPSTAKMARSRGAAPSRSAPSRPTASAPPRAAPPQQQQQQRPYSSTPAAPAQAQVAHPPAAQASQGPGLFGQMASTAA